MDFKTTRARARGLDAGGPAPRFWSQYRPGANHPRLSRTARGGERWAFPRAAGGFQPVCWAPLCRAISARG
jgi:hypothetical protein